MSDAPETIDAMSADHNKILREYRLSATEAQAVLAIAATNSADALNDWWLQTGQRHGFVWTTLQNLTFLGQDGRPFAPMIIDSEVTGATFEAQPEAPAEPDFADALLWIYQRFTDYVADSGMHLDDLPFSGTDLCHAFNAGRDKGFAMGQACVVQADTDRLKTIEGLALSLVMDIGDMFINRAPGIDVGTWEEWVGPEMWSSYTRLRETFDAADPGLEAASRQAAFVARTEGLVENAPNRAEFLIDMGGAADIFDTAERWLPVGGRGEFKGPVFAQKLRQLIDMARISAVQAGAVRVEYGNVTLKLGADTKGVALLIEAAAAMRAESPENFNDRIAPRGFRIDQMQGIAARIEEYLVGVHLDDAPAKGTAEMGFDLSTQDPRFNANTPLTVNGFAFWPTATVESWRGAANSFEEEVGRLTSLAAQRFEAMERAAKDRDEAQSKLDRISDLLNSPYPRRLIVEDPHAVPGDSVWQPDPGTAEEGYMAERSPWQPHPDTVKGSEPYLIGMAGERLSIGDRVHFNPKDGMIRKVDTKPTRSPPAEGLEDCRQ
jgi:hypothetical protein